MLLVIEFTKAPDVFAGSSGAPINAFWFLLLWSISTLSGGLGWVSGSCCFFHFVADTHTLQDNLIELRITVGVCLGILLWCYPERLGNSNVKIIPGCGTLLFERLASWVLCNLTIVAIDDSLESVEVFACWLSGLLTR